MKVTKDATSQWQSVEAEGQLYTKEYPVYERRSFGLQMEDIHQPIDFDRMRRERLAKTRKAMKEAGISVMLLMQNENMRYSVAYTWQAYEAGGAYVLLPLEGDPILWAHLSTSVQLRRQVSWLKPENIRTSIWGINTSTQTMNPPAFATQSGRLAKQVKAALEEKGLTKETLVMDVATDIMPAFQKEGIKIAVDPAVMVRAQEIKTQDEIECFRACANIVDICHYEFSKYAEPGKTERELAGYMSFLGMKYGCEPTPNCLVDSGQYTHPHYCYPTNRMLTVGDIFFVDAIQFSWNGYKSCCYRTYSCVTPPSQAAVDAVKRVQSYFDNALSDCKPGNTTADMMKHWKKEPLIHGGTMHGLGIRNYGPPWGRVEHSFEAPYELKEGHVFAIETQSGIGDGQAARLEDMVVVTKTGCEVLNHVPRDIVTCPR